MKRALLVTSLVCSALVGCGDDKPAATLNTMPPTGNEETEAGEQDGSSAGESGGPQDTGSDPNPTSSTAPAETGESEGGSSETGMPFIEMKDIPDGAVECNPFAQDCKDGFKCVPWANDGSTSWNADKCEMIREGDTKVAGDACFADAGGVGGIDDCAKGFFCWNVDAMMNGFCVQLCTGSADAPDCEDTDTTCAVYNMGTLPLCLSRCDPSLQDCPDGEGCIKNPSDDGFLCVPDASGEEGQQHDPCEFANACDPGQVCSPTTASSDCDPNAIGCCQPICSLNENNCTDPQKCTMFEETPDPEFGFCSI